MLEFDWSIWLINKKLVKDLIINKTVLKYTNI